MRLLFGDNIQKIRLQKNMSVKDLAEKVGLSIPTISLLERSTGYTTTVKRLQDIAEALDVTVDDLLRDDLTINFSEPVTDLGEEILKAFYLLTNEKKVYISKLADELFRLKSSKLKSVSSNKMISLFEEYSEDEQKELYEIFKKIDSLHHSDVACKET